MSGDAGKTKAQLRDELEQTLRRLTTLEREEACRQETEETIRRLAAIVQSSDDAIVGKRLDGTITSWNEGAERLYGYSAAEAIGQSIDMLVPPGYPNEIPQILARIREGHRVDRFETVRRRKDGSACPVSLRVSPIRDSEGRVVGASAISRDITEWRRMEETLRASETRYRTLFEMTPHGVAECDRSGVFLACNRAYHRMLEYDEGELLGRNALDTVHPEERDRAARQIEAVMSEEPVEQPYKGRALTKGGRVIDIEVAWDVKRDQAGRPGGAVFVVTDVTQRRRAEEALREEQRLLRQLLDTYERERQLLAYEIHDGAAQHVAGASLHLDAARRRWAEDRAAAEEDFNRGMASLAHAAVEIRRLISGLRPPALDELGVVAAIESLVAEARRSDGPEIELVTDGALERLPAPLENSIFRIVQEALNNARRHSASEKIRVSLAAQNSSIEIEVRDWGRGFDPQAAGRDRFGLRGIRERARILGGQARIMTSPGEGTCVRVALPRAVPTDEGGGPG